MSLRLSLVLIVIFAMAAIAVALFIKNAPEPEKEPSPPYFYTLSATDITNIAIVVRDDVFSWHVRHEDDRDRWYFDSPEDIPVDHNRWGGITTLLGGPRTQRLLSDSFDDPTLYGLDDPQIKIQVTLRDGNSITLHIGNVTPDGEGHYARNAGMPQLQLVDSSWGAVLERLVVEPPLPAWYYGEAIGPKIENTRQALFYSGSEIVRAFGYNDGDYPDKEDGWYLCDLPLQADEPCTGAVSLDTQGIEDYLSIILEPQIHNVAAFGAGDLWEQLLPMFDEYGTGEDAPYISLRQESKREDSITEVTSISISLGDLTPDGSEMYAVTMDSRDVLRIDADWGKSILALFEAELPLAE